MIEQEPIEQESNHFDYEALPDEFKPTVYPFRIHHVGLVSVYGAEEVLNHELLDEMKRMDMSHIAEDGTEMGIAEIKALLYCKFLLGEAPEGLEKRVGFNGYKAKKTADDKPGEICGEKRAHFEAKIRSIIRELAQKGTLTSNHGIEIYYSLLGEGVIRDKSMAPERVIDEFAACWENVMLGKIVDENEDNITDNSQGYCLSLKKLKQNKSQ
jgi:hypothetical protein